MKIFDTLSGYEQSAMCLPGKFIACNSKYQFLATLDSHPQTIVLLQGKTIVMNNEHSIKENLIT